MRLSVTLIKNEDERATYVKRLKAHFEGWPSLGYSLSKCCRRAHKNNGDSAPGSDLVRYSYLKDLTEEELHELTGVL